MATEEDLWWIAEYLLEIPHTRLLRPGMARALSRVDRRALTAARVGQREH